jgi:hypothetical protein
MRTVTFDSTSKPDDALTLRLRASGWDVAFSTVSRRELHGAEFGALKRVPELAVWNESTWNVARWADAASSERLQRILAIISNGSFPKQRDCLTEGQRHQLRDAMILEAHFASGRDVFVSSDAKAFIRDGRREKLEALLQTRILSPTEFEIEFGHQLKGT